MASMDYCKFENAIDEMNACLRALEDGRKTSERECEKAEYLFEQILGTMMDLGVIDEYDGDLLHDFCYEMNEGNE